MPTPTHYNWFERVMVHPTTGKVLLVGCIIEILYITYRIAEAAQAAGV